MCNISNWLRPCSAIDGKQAQAPVPLTIFRSNLKFKQNLQCPDLIYTLPITKKFCTHHDSYTVVMCAKFRCHQLNKP